jgi:all-trans-retinol 13,14-reductase
MNSRFDAVVIGSGLGGLTAGALLAKAGFSVCLLERNTSLGGAASVYRVGKLTIEASLHQSADPRDPHDPKHGILERLGLLDKIEWLPAGDLYTVRGAAVGEPFVLPHGFENARRALNARFPKAMAPIERVMDALERAYHGPAFPEVGPASVPSLHASGAAPERSQASLDEVFAAEFQDNEALKFALAANLAYYSDDPARLSWPFFATAQGAYVGSGGVYIQGGSRQLSVKLAGSIKRSGGTVLLGSAAAAIEMSAGGTVAAVHTLARGARKAERIETSLVLANCSPSAVSRMLPAGARRDFDQAFDGFAHSTSLFAAHFGLKTPPALFGLNDYSTVLLPGWIRRLQDYPQSARLLASRPDGRMPVLGIENYGALDAGLDPEGPILVTVVGADRISNWRGLSKEAEAVRRNAWLDAILGEMERHFPGFAGAAAEKVFMNAGAMERYLGTPGGAVYGFEPLPPQQSFPAGSLPSPKTPVGGLFLASAFAGSGGYTGAMASGARAAGMAEAVLRQTEQ